VAVVVGEGVEERGLARLKQAEDHDLGGHAHI
jgi:hypothetical protein